MNWDAIGAVGEILGAMAVFLSLVYLASQIRAQNRESRISSVHEITEAFRQSLEVLSVPEMAQIYVKGVINIDELSDWERISFIAMVQGFLRVWEEAYYQHSEQRLDDGNWGAMDTQFGDAISSTGFQQVWLLRKAYYRKEFRDYVDSLDIAGKTYRI
jgi:hypothetical protein